MRNRLVQLIRMNGSTRQMWVKAVFIVRFGDETLKINAKSDSRFLNHAEKIIDAIVKIVWLTGPVMVLHELIPLICLFLKHDVGLHKMNHVTRKPDFGFCEQIKHKAACAATESS